jgi:hypothetical protein
MAFTHRKSGLYEENQCQVLSSVSRTLKFSVDWIFSPQTLLELGLTCFLVLLQTTCQL